MRQRKNRGFTLLEVVVVAAITSVIFLLGFKWIYSLTTASSGVLMNRQAAQMTYALDRLEADVKSFYTCDQYSLLAPLSAFNSKNLQFTTRDADGQISQIQWRLQDGSLQRASQTALGQDCSFIAPNEGSWKTVAQNVAGNPDLFTLVSQGKELNDFDAGLCITNDSCPVDAIKVSIVSTTDPAATTRTFEVKQGVTKQGQPKANIPPVASFTGGLAYLNATFDGSASNDPDGTIEAWAWDFGDGTFDSTSGAHATHTYGQAGTFTVKLTVTDNKGAVTEFAGPFTAEEPPNTPPVALFTTSVTDLAVNFDASQSSDPDGTIASWSWAFGDSSTSTGQKVSHTYPASGTYNATLTVVDNRGASATTTTQVTVVAPPPYQINDAFNRVTTSGWGTSTTGGDWTVNSLGYTSTDGSRAVMNVRAGSTVTASLSSATLLSSDLNVTFSANKPMAGATGYAVVALRNNGTNQGYGGRIKLLSDGTLQEHITVNGTAVAGGNLAGSFAGGDQLKMRLQVTGTNPTTVRLKVWRVGQPEPSSWMTTYTDTTAALQTTGGLFISSFIGSGATNAPIQFYYDDLTVSMAT